MSLAGTDPRPQDGGMVTSDAVIRSFASAVATLDTPQDPQARVIVHAPASLDADVRFAADGARELDRTRPWRFTNP